MAGQHKKKKEAGKRRWPWILLVLAVIAALAVGSWFLYVSEDSVQVLSLVQNWLRSSTDTTTAPTDSTEPLLTDTRAGARTTVPTRPTTPGVFARPTPVKGVWAEPGRDWLTKTDAPSMRSDVHGILTQMEAWRFNTLYLPAQTAVGQPLYGEGAVTVTEADGTPVSPLGYAVQQAHVKGMYVCFAVDLGVSSGRCDPADEASVAAAISRIHRLLDTVSPDALLLTGYLAPAGKAVSPASQATLIKEVTDALKIRNNDLYIGLLSAAAPETDAAGNTVLKEGQAPIGLWLKNRWVDFVMADLPMSLSGAYTASLTAWNELCAAEGLPLYVRHAAVNTENGTGDWASPDQLTKQVLTCMEQTAWQGSVFDSYQALLKDTDGSTRVLLTAFEGTVQKAFITNQLNVSSPESQSVTTKESGISFAGSADPNFPLTVNGAPVEVTAKGYFAWNTTLKPGKNTVTLVHKGRTLTYTVYYELTVLDTVYPQSSLTLDGGSEVVLSAVARTGSVVTATVGGSRVTLKVTARNEEEDNGEIPSDFSYYTGTYTFPKGKVGASLSLGSVVFSASYQGQTAKKTGGRLTVAALPRPTTTTTVLTTTTTTTTVSATTTGGDSPTETTKKTTKKTTQKTTTTTAAVSTAAGAPELPKSLTVLDPAAGGATLATGKIVTVNCDFAMTSSVSKVGKNRPDYAFLPRGTTDVVTGTVADSGLTYYKLGSGRAVQTGLFSVYKNSGKLTANTIKANSVTVGTTHTVLTLDSLWRVPYTLTGLPQSYPYANSKYLFDISGQTATYIQLKFYYTTKIPAAPSVSGSPLFKSASWVKNDDNTCSLRLYLKNTGAFYGYSVAWDNSGRLTFAFKHPYKVKSGSKPLSGCRIVVDPGHGGSTRDTRYYASDGSYTTETLLVLKYGLELQKQLKAAGATVIMTRTKDAQCPELETRVKNARNNNTDLFLSLHMDASNGTARGGSVHYFNEYSYGFARQIFEGMKQTWLKYDPKQAQVRGAKWNSFHVVRLHDCPAVLLECGFLDNPKDRELLTDAAFIQDFCTGIVDSIETYYKSVK